MTSPGDGSPKAHVESAEVSAKRPVAAERDIWWGDLLTIESLMEMSFSCYFARQLR